MIHLQYIPISLAVFVLSFWLFRQAAGSLSLRRLNIVSWIFYFSLIVQNFIGINLVYIFEVEHYLMIKADRTYLTMAYWAINYTLIAMPLAMIVIQRTLWGEKIKQKLHAYFETPLRWYQSPKDSALLVFWAGMSAIATMATIYVYFNIRNAPFLTVIFSFDDLTSDFAQMRISAGRNFEGIVYIRNIFSFLLAPIVSYTIYTYSLLYPKNFRIRIWFYATLLVAVLALTSDGQKGPILNYLLALFFIQGFVRGGFSLIKLVTTGIVITFFIIILYLLSVNTVSVALTTGPIGRVILSSVAGVPMHFMIFPNTQAFLSGASFPNWISSTLFGVEHVRSARVVMEIINPAGVANNTAGVMNALFIAEAWANFGWIGLIVAPWLVGFVVQSIHNTLLVLPKTPIFVAIMGYLMVNIVINGGFVDFIWNVSWIIIVIFTLMAISLRSILLTPRLMQQRAVDVSADQ